MANGLQPIDILNPLQQGLQIRGQREQQERARGLAPLQLQQAEQQIESGQLGIETGQQQLGSAREQARLQSLVTGSLQLQQLPDEQKLPFLQQRRQQLIAQNLPTMDTDEAIQLAQAGDFETINQIADQGVQLGQQLGLLQTGRQAASPRAFEPRVTAEGELVAPVFDPATQTLTLEGVEGGPSFQTADQKRAAELEQQRELATIATDKARATKRAQLQEDRASNLRAEFSERNRNAARSQRTLNEALTLAQQATQGLPGAAKLQLGRLIPGIDVADEAALNSTLNRLALEQLQNFKGPTTDFEFGVTQSIAGRGLDSRTANIGRLKSLQRARFFNEKESQQFNDFIKDGGDPDQFRFDFNEIVTTDKGDFSLKDLQDTAVQNAMSIEEVIQKLNERPDAQVVVETGE